MRVIWTQGLWIYSEKGGTNPDRVWKGFLVEGTVYAIAWRLEDVFKMKHSVWREINTTLIFFIWSIYPPSKLDLRKLSDLLESLSKNRVPGLFNSNACSPPGRSEPGMQSRPRVNVSRWRSDRSLYFTPLLSMNSMLLSTPTLTPRTTVCK